MNDTELKPFKGLLTRLLHEAFYLEEGLEEIPLLEKDDDEDSEFLHQFLKGLAS